MKFERKVSLNRQNKRVEFNIKQIVEQLVKEGMEQIQIARKAGVSPSTVASWVKKGRASASAVDRLLENLQYMENKMNGSGSFIELMLCIKKIKQLGFDVTLKPNF